MDRRHLAIALIVGLAVGLVLGRAPKDVRILRDITYASPNGSAQKLDLYLPSGDKWETPRPLVAWIHGGGWESGSKGHGGRILPLVEKGFAVADINYRLSGEAPFPAQAIDCKSAIRWLRANAEKFNLDPTRIGVAGASAGGHLCALLGTSAGTREFDVGENLAHSSAVQAVCALSAPTMVTVLKDQASPKDMETITKLVGGNPLEEPYSSLVRKVDLLGYVSGNEPPFLIIHGNRDRTVPCSQATLLHKALKKADVESKLFVVNKGDHNLNGGSNAGRDYIDRMITKFFVKNLQP